MAFMTLSFFAECHLFECNIRCLEFKFAKFKSFTEKSMGVIFRNSKDGLCFKQFPKNTGQFSLCMCWCVSTLVDRFVNISIPWQCHHVGIPEESNYVATVAKETVGVAV